MMFNEYVCAIGGRRYAALKLSMEFHPGFAPRANNKVAASRLGFSPFGRSSQAAGIYPLLSKINCYQPIRGA